MLDVIIIGKGPAGMSAAIYLKRANKQVTVIGRDYGALEKAEQIENYYGFEKPISGKKLIESGIAQGERLGIPVLSQEVLSITKDSHFMVKTEQGVYESKLVILATGKSRTSLPVPGFEAFKGLGISFCAICDGFFYRNQTLAVIGDGEYALEEIEVLSQFTKEITLFSNGKPLTMKALPSYVTHVSDLITEITGNKTVEQIRTKTAEYPVNGIFVAIGTANASDFALKLGVMVENNNILVNDGFETNLQGLYAVGDCTGGLLQIGKAVHEGSVAAIAAITALKKEK